MESINSQNIEFLARFTVPAPVVLTLNPSRKQVAVTFVTLLHLLASLAKLVLIIFLSVHSCKTVDPCFESPAEHLLVYEG